MRAAGTIPRVSSHWKMPVPLPRLEAAMFHCFLLDSSLRGGLFMLRAWSSDREAATPVM